MKRCFTFFVLIAALLMVAAPLSAHHGRGSTYSDGEVTLKGTVTEISWRNPHVVVYMDVPDENGNVVNWGFENSNVVTLARQGYHRNTLRVGEPITAIVHPSASGAPVGIVVTIILEDGTEIMSRGDGGGNPADSADYPVVD